MVVPCFYRSYLLGYPSRFLGVEGLERLPAQLPLHVEVEVARPHGGRLPSGGQRQLPLLEVEVHVEVLARSRARGD